MAHSFDENNQNYLLKEPSIRVIGPGRVYLTGTGLADWALRYSL